MLGRVLSILAFILSVYTLLCVIYILLSWIPSLNNSKFGRFINTICTPYMALFRNIRFLRIGYVDFSPIISIGILSLLSSILSGITTTGVIHIGSILATVIQMVWSLASSLLLILFLLILIRWITLLSNKGSSSIGSAWSRVDYILNPIVTRISNTFKKGGSSYKVSLLVSWISIAVISLICSVLFHYLTTFLYSLPF